MLYILYGEDDFSLKEQLSELKEGADVQVLAAEKLSLGELLRICSTLPFLAPRRLVIVKGLLGRFEPRGELLESSEWSNLAERVAQLPSTTTLVLVDGKLSPANPLLKKLFPKAKVREFKPLRGAELQSWIHERVTRLGNRISPRAARLLAELVGGNLWMLSQELEKLCLAAQGRQIEEKDVLELVSYAKEANIFSLADAIVGRQLRRALHLLRDLLSQGAAPTYLLYMITRQFRLVIQAGELASRGLSAEEISQELGLTSDFLLEKALEQAANYSGERLEEIYRRLLKADVLTKMGRLSGELALELLVAEICS